MGFGIVSMMFLASSRAMASTSAARLRAVISLNANTAPSIRLSVVRCVDEVLAWDLLRADRLLPEGLLSGFRGRGLSVLTASKPRRASPRPQDLEFCKEAVED